MPTLTSLSLRTSSIRVHSGLLCWCRACNYLRNVSVNIHSGTLSLTSFPCVDRLPLNSELWVADTNDCQCVCGRAPRDSHPHYIPSKGTAQIVGPLDFEITQLAVVPRKFLADGARRRVFARQRHIRVVSGVIGVCDLPHVSVSSIQSVLWNSRRTRRLQVALFTGPGRTPTVGPPRPTETPVWTSSQAELARCTMFAEAPLFPLGVAAGNAPAPKGRVQKRKLACMLEGRMGML